MSSRLLLNRVFALPFHDGYLFVDEFAFVSSAALNALELTGAADEQELSLGCHLRWISSGRSGGALSRIFGEDRLAVCGRPGIALGSSGSLE